VSTDDFAGTLANQTNLAIKGIIGIRAMGLMANVMGNTADEQNFTVSIHCHYYHVHHTIRYYQKQTS